MSSSLPPSGPQAPSSRRRPLRIHRAGGPEVLEQGGGAPLAPAPAARNLKPVLIGGAAVAARRRGRRRSLGGDVLLLDR